MQAYINATPHSAEVDLLFFRPRGRAPRRCEYKIVGIWKQELVSLTLRRIRYRSESPHVALNTSGSCKVSVA